MTDHWYRYHDVLYESGPKITLTSYPIHKHTPKGAWIDVYGTKRFCLSGAGKRFAHESKELALHSYLARKSRQARINRARLQDAEICIGIGQYMQREGRYLDAYEAIGVYDVPLDSAFG